MLLVVSILLLWFATLVQTYVGLTGEVKAAHVVATAVGNEAHRLNVDLTLYDDAGKASAHQTYDVEGDMWALQAGIVELQHWVNILGMHSGYKVTRLFGQRLDGVVNGQLKLPMGGHENCS